MSAAVQASSRGTGAGADAHRRNVDGTAGDQAVEKRLENLEDELRIAKAYGSLNDVEKSHYNSLDDDGKSGFLKLDAEGRGNAIEKAKGDDPVVYTAEDGTEFRKSDDPRVIVEVRTTGQQRAP